MKYLILVAALLTGCATNDGFNNTEVIVQKDYIVRTAPDALKTLPPLPPAIPNPAAASNNQVAAWINNTEEYVSNLEAMIQTLVNFYEKPVTTNEAKDMRVVTPLSSATPTPARVIQPQTTAPSTQAPEVPEVYTDPIQRLRTQ